MVAVSYDAGYRLRIMLQAGVHSCAYHRLIAGEKLVSWASNLKTLHKCAVLTPGSVCTLSFDGIKARHWLLRGPIMNTAVVKQR
jgi:hypothetical protein